MDLPRLAVAAIVVAAVVLLAACRPGASGGRTDAFWTRHGGAVPADEQVRRADAAGKGVPDAPWAETYWPPRYCWGGGRGRAESYAPRRPGHHHSHRHEPGDYYETSRRPPARVAGPGRRALPDPHWYPCPCPGEPRLTCRCLPAWRRPGPWPAA